MYIDQVRIPDSPADIERAERIAAIDKRLSAIAFCYYEDLPDIDKARIDELLDERNEHANG